MELSRFPLCGAAMVVILGQSAAALAADCFVDSVAGDDTKDGSSEANAVKSQAKIPKACTTVKYKRGSLFNEKVAISSTAKVYTNYGNPSDPLPQFVMPGTKNTGAVVSAYQGGITIDGLSLANSHGDGSSSSFSTGVCVTIGGSTVFQNNEITSCDIGVMLSGSGSKFLNNYVHDLNTMIVDASIDSGANINSVGGAEGIFINGSDNEVAYNRFINCTTVAAWTGGSCDGGATEVSIGNNGTVSGVKIHHNFAYNTCGFFEVSSGGKGIFADSEFYDNIMVDSGWMFLFQVNNTTPSNIRWENNTVVYHAGSGSSYAPTVSMIYNGTGTTGGAATGTVPANSTFFNNNLVIYDGYSNTGSVDKNIVQNNNLFVNTSKTTGVVKNVGKAAAMPEVTDFELVAGSPAIDQGMVIENITLDFLNRKVPSGAAPDIGAFEYGAEASTEGGAANYGGAASTGGTKAAATGGTSSNGAGGSGKAGAASNPATGGKGVGGATSTLATSSPATGGNSSATPSNGGGQTKPDATGGQTSEPSTAPTGGRDDTSSNPENGGQQDQGSAGDSTGQGGAEATAPVTSGGVTTKAAQVGVKDSGCNCRVNASSQSPIGVGLLGLLVLGLRGRLARRRRA
jgi:MYXO-CTERM domain-containing protein